MIKMSICFFFVREMFKTTQVFWLQNGVPGGFGKRVTTPPIGKALMRKKLLPH